MILVTPINTVVVGTFSNDTVVKINEVVAVVSTTGGMQGPRGINAEDLDMYTKRIDFSIDGTYLYKGEAPAGSISSAPVWRIRRIDMYTDGDISETWAGGNTNFDNIWDNRSSEVYS